MKINYLTEVKVKSEANTNWRIIELDLSKAGISYRPDKAIMIVPNRDQPLEAGKVLMLHPDSRVDIMTRLLSFEVLREQAWTADPEEVARKLSTFKEEFNY